MLIKFTDWIIRWAFCVCWTIRSEEEIFSARLSRFSGFRFQPLHKTSLCVLQSQLDGPGNTRALSQLLAKSIGSEEGNLSNTEVVT